jgi:hypothetical protein
VGCQWLTTVILATQEAEIRRIMVLSQFWANSLRDPISKKDITKKNQIKQKKKNPKKDIMKKGW